MGRIDFATSSIGAADGAFVIAEAGVNHNGDIDLAMRLVEVAAEAGADAVKFQTFKADRLVTGEAEMADYQKTNSGREESQFAMLRRLELSEEMHEALMERCDELGIIFMSTPFDELSADFLERLGVRLFKVPSGEITNTPFLRHLSRIGLPMVLSTGMSTLADVETAVRAIEEEGHPDVAILHCVSNYPADPADTNLRAMQVLRSFGYPVGYSDHTLGIAVPIAAVALGAKVIEKHFTLDRELPGPDHRASLEPDELTAMMDGIRTVERAMGDGRKRPVASEMQTAKVARKSIVAGRDIAAGEVIDRDALAIKRPGTGLPPTALDLVVGRRARTAIVRDALVDLGELE